MTREETSLKGIDKYRITPAAKLHLKNFDANETSLFEGDKEQAEEVLLNLRKELDALQELFYINGKHKLLIVLQGMDTAGKDGTIRSVFSGVNPQGVKVTCFKQPTQPELSHDFLWRIHTSVPANGEIVIFNRSHYEDVLVVRVHNLVSAHVWQKRYDHIKAFEQMLCDEGTIILKFFLHIDLAEQLARIEKRIDEKEKHWKLSEADAAERKLWPDYMKAYEEAIAQTSSERAPWYVVPANKKWYRNLIIASVVVDALKGLKLSYPKTNIDLEKFRRQLTEK